MRKVIAKSFQVLGLLVTGLALFYGIYLSSMSLELFSLMAGGALFMIGYAIDPGE